MKNSFLSIDSFFEFISEQKFGKEQTSYVINAFKEEGDRFVQTDFNIVDDIERLTDYVRTLCKKYCNNVLPTVYSLYEVYYENIDNVVRLGIVKHVFSYETHEFLFSDGYFYKIEWMEIESVNHHYN